MIGDLSHHGLDCFTASSCVFLDRNLYGRKIQDNYNCFTVILMDNLFRIRETFQVIAITDFQVKV